VEGEKHQTGTERGDGRTLSLAFQKRTQREKPGRKMKLRKMAIRGQGLKGISPRKLLVEWCRIKGKHTTVGLQDWLNPVSCHVLKEVPERAERRNASCTGTASLNPASIGGGDPRTPWKTRRLRKRTRVIRIDKTDGRPCNVWGEITRFAPMLEPRYFGSQEPSKGLKFADRYLGWQKTISGCGL